MCREGADRAMTDAGWVGRIILLGGPCAGCLLSRTPEPVRPPLSCCKNIFPVLDHAAAGAGSRRLQKERVLNCGNPNNTPKRLMHAIPSGLGASGGCPRALLSCSWRWRCGHPTPNPSTPCSTFSSCFPPQGSWFSPSISMQACWWQAALVPLPTANSQPQEQSFLSQSFVSWSNPRPWAIVQVDVYVAGSWKWTTTRSTRRYPRASLVWATGFTFILPWSKFDPWHCQCLRLQVAMK
jgi:hypothetical protein